MESQGGGGPGQEARLDRATSRTMAEAETSTGQAFDPHQILRELVTSFNRFI